MTFFCHVASQTGLRKDSDIRGVIGAQVSHDERGKITRPGVFDNSACGLLKATDSVGEHLLILAFHRPHDGDHFAFKLAQISQRGGGIADFCARGPREKQCSSS